MFNSLSANPTSIDYPGGLVTFALNFSDANGDYKEILLDLIYSDGTRETKNPIAIPGNLDGNVGPVSVNLPVNFQPSDPDNYRFAFKIKDDAGRTSNERVIEIHVD